MTVRITSPQKPWLEQTPWETTKMRVHRLNRSCYQCGLFVEDRDALVAHEDSCRREHRYGAECGCGACGEDEG